ncbi:DEAD/DEAH box helicase [Candidatus Woesearchaeota archaeon]|nr:DEAD/DEAH box helicase [Candidatus Woesearchaeota archaeon]
MLPPPTGQPPKTHIKKPKISDHMNGSDLNELFFPHEDVRAIQDQLVSEISETIRQKGNLIAHAPTGLGKTAAALAPALSHALKNELSVFFLTSRHTQHLIAIDTLSKIKQRYNLKFDAVDIIGKKWMCPVPGTDTLYSKEFTEYCKKQKEDYRCEFYSNTKAKAGKIKEGAEKVLEKIKNISPSHVEKIAEVCSQAKVCPYELSMMLASSSSVVISDYNYVFNPGIMDTFFLKAKKDLEKSIIIIDEGHNLSHRLREQMTERLSNFILKRAVREAEKHSNDEVIQYLDLIRDALDQLSRNLGMGKEKLVARHEFTRKIELIGDYEQVVADLEFAGDEIREKSKKSYVGSVASFLDRWRGPDEGFARILAVKKVNSMPYVCLSYRCLDPSLITKDIFRNAYATIMMSGTLTPTSMYKDIMGFPNSTVEREYGSPFPSKNRLCLLVPETTTRYAKRSDQQFRHIAEITSRIANMVPGNSAIFFPSYSLRDQINRHLASQLKKTTFLESPGLTKQEKQDLLHEFKQYKDQGAVLLGVASGSFGEGIDLPGDLLKAVIVVGLPLQVPDLETKELIRYYDNKFQKGWEYGYVLPAITRALQNAGRCIRSETDRGAIIFLDERYAWPNYRRCFPADWDTKVTKMYEDRIREFFAE